MGNKGSLHKAAKVGDNEKLQRLLNEGTYNVNHGSSEEGFEGVSVRVERKREREKEEW